MRLKIYHIVFCLGIFMIACNTEEGIEPGSQDAYIKIIQGLGEDEPLAIKLLSDGNLLVVTNNVFFEQSTPSEKIRVLKLNLDGGIIEQKSFPENLAGNWRAKDIVLTEGNRILIGGTMRSGNQDTSLLFLEINESLDSINFQSYSDSQFGTINLAGLYPDENNNELLFIGSTGDQTTLYGELILDNLSIKDIQTSNKPEASPATTLHREDNGKIIWALDFNRLVLLRSDKNMRTIDNPDDVSFSNVNPDIINTKKLMANEGEISVFGDISDDNESSIFYYKAFSGSPITFGGEGSTTLNGVSRAAENGYLVTGADEIQLGGQNTQQSDFYLSRIGAGLGMDFNHSFGSNVDEALYDAIMINNNIYSIGTTVFSGNNTLVLIKTNQFGELKK